MAAAGGLRRIYVDRRGSVLQRNADVHAGHFHEPALEREDEPGCRAAGARFGQALRREPVAESSHFTRPSKRSWRGLLILSEEAAKRHRQAHDGFLAHLALPTDPVRG